MMHTHKEDAHVCTRNNPSEQVLHPCNLLIEWQYSISLTLRHILHKNQVQKTYAQHNTKRLVLTTAFNDANGKRDCKEDEHGCPRHFVQKIEIDERSSPENLFNTRPNMIARQQSLCRCTYKGEDLKVQPDHIECDKIIKKPHNAAGRRGGCQRV